MFQFKLDDGKVMAAFCAPVQQPNFVPVSEEAYNAYVQDGGKNICRISADGTVTIEPRIKPPPSPAEIMAAIVTAADELATARLNAFAHAAEYNTIQNMMINDGSPLPQFDADGKLAKQYYADIWTSLAAQQAQILQRITDGELALPTSLSEVSGWLANLVTLPATPPRIVVDPPMVHARADVLAKGQEQ